MNDTTLLLGLPGVVVDRVEVDPDGARVVHVSALDTPQACPSCGVSATSVKGWVTTGPRDVPFPVPARLVWRKRRWRCQESACARSSFTESVPQIPVGKRVTVRLRASGGTRGRRRGPDGGTGRAGLRPVLAGGPRGFPRPRQHGASRGAGTGGGLGNR